MTRRTQQEKQESRERYEARVRQEEIACDIEGLKRDPLFRETLRKGINYDTGDPFRMFAYHMVNASGYQNIVLKTSGGTVLEADRKEVRERRNNGKIGILERFDPTAGNYVISAPYFTKVARLLCNEIDRAVSHGQSVSIEVNVESPFKEEVK